MAIVAQNIRRANAGLLLVALACASAVVTGAGRSAVSSVCGAHHGHPPHVYRHVITIVMENHPFSAIDGGSPYLNSLSRECGLATSYSAITHPSLPNYLALTSGGTQAITDDCDDCSTTAVSVFQQLRPRGWRTYEESMPEPGYTGAAVGTYTKHHNPAAYYVNLAVWLAANDVPLGSVSSGRLASDLRADRLRRYTLIVPNKCNDEHDCAVLTGDTWLRRWVQRIVASPAYLRGATALFITYDEGSDADNHVYTAVVSPYTAPGTTSAKPFDHYSLLKTQEQMLGLACLGHACDSATASMRSAFGL